MAVELYCGQVEKLEFRTDKRKKCDEMDSQNTV